jgi:ceramide glucosyltransferase
LLVLSSITKILLGLGLFGLVCSSVYLVLVMIAVHGFAQRRRDLAVRHATASSPLSLLKPLHGGEPNLETHLESFFRQEYPNYEILFCARHDEDAGLQIARLVAARYPALPAQFLTTGEPAYTNAKVASLERMAAAARHDIFIISDSDVRVDPNYLREVAAPFADPKVGVVTCLYRGIAQGNNLWPQLEATAMSIEMTAGVLVAERLEGMQFALGPTMAARRGCVDEIGGFGVLGEYCSDDFLLGNWIARNGHEVVLSDHVIDHVILNEGFLQSIKHQIRWMKSTRFSRPKGHFGTALTFSTPFGLLACVSAMILGFPLAGLCLLAWSIATRMWLAAAIGKQVVGERNLLRTVLLYPLRDLMGFGYWASSYISNRILWRGEVFELLKDGLMRRYSRSPAANPLEEETLIPPHR